MKIRDVCITGAGGYVGSLLVPRLLEAGYRVTALDTFWFGDYLPVHPALTILKRDIRQLSGWDFQGHDAVIHLACISNDTCCQLDEALSTSINYDAFEPLVLAAKRAGVRRFIYCSSISAYGSTTAPTVNEDHPLSGLTLYGKYKGLCEPLLLKHLDDSFTGVIVRPATACGYAPRMRFDLTVNILTMHAILKRRITVHGGDQERPHLHIRDMCRMYEELLEVPKEKIQGQVFNVGSRNVSLLEIAQSIKDVVEQELPGAPIAIEIQPRQDDRTYSISCEKIKKAIGFEPEFTFEDAVRDLVWKFQAGEFEDALTNPLYTNVLQYVEKHGFGK